MASDDMTGPPIAERELIGLFKTARRRTGDSSLLADATAASAAVASALNDVLDGLGKTGADPHTRYQLLHIFDALTTVAGKSQTGSGSVLDAVQDALGHVEKAFDQWPPRAEAVTRPWFRHQLLLQIVQELIGEAAREDAEGTWYAVSRLRTLLGSEGVRVLSYDPEASPEQQADAFSVEDYAKSPDGRYETDLPAIAVTGADGNRKILARGRVLRLPADGPAGGPMTGELEDPMGGTAWPS